MSDTDSISLADAGNRRLRDVQAQATRAALLAAARLCFVRSGYALTTLDDIAQAAGTTKGAVYHHFRDKKALFRAVYESLSQELVRDIDEHELAQGGGIQVALRTFLLRASEASFRSVLFTDGPGVLGVEDCRAIDSRYSLGLLTRLVRQHMAPEVVNTVDSDLLATLMLALVIESGRILAQASGRQAGLPLAAGQLEFLLGRMLQALQTDHGCQTEPVHGGVTSPDTPAAG